MHKPNPTAAAVSAEHIRKLSGELVTALRQQPENRNEHLWLLTVILKDLVQVHGHLELLVPMMKIARALEDVEKELEHVFNAERTAKGEGVADVLNQMKYLLGDTPSE